ncbi:putative histidine-containing phosphotransfer protein 1-like isoform X1 [Capsicum annuum]|nr:putative histidine-containing phosphotransfer protein 1-like isoform X1 [Capsicum annuum]
MSRGGGPFQVLERINDNAYKIDLPPEYQVHKTFNICDLSPIAKVENEHPPNLRKNSLEDGEDDTSATSSRSFTSSQTRELQKLQAMIMQRAGKRQYSPLRQPTAQQVMIKTISSGPTVVFLIGAHTNFALFLLSNPHLKKNVEHIYIMGGGVRLQNSTGCCPKNSTSSCQPRPCGDYGNLFTAYSSNPYAEFNFFMDPFAAYQVINSGIPVTLVPLDATNTIPITEEFFETFEKNQHTYEAQYCFKSLKIIRDTLFGDQFYTSYFMWDSFMSGVATSIMKKRQNHQGENEFAEMEYINITVVTSNMPYGISDGSNPFIDGRTTPKFNLEKTGVHSGHVHTRLHDPFCVIKNGRGKCQDGYTEEVVGHRGVPVRVAVRAKPNQNPKSTLDREFFVSFLDVLNQRENSGLFNFSTQFPHYSGKLHKPDLRSKKLGKNVVFDMDMSAGDFIALIYLLKLPVKEINLKAIIVSPTGWANAATIDSVYDLLHMMGRDDIPVGLGEVSAMNQSDPVFSAVGDCKYNKVIPQGSGGFLDSDTLYGLSRSLPRSPRRYTAENSVKFGAPRDTDHPELRQPLALEVWDSVVKSLDPGSKDIVVVGGHINHDKTDKGNVINVPSNKFAELNMFLDPLAAKTVLSSELNITLIPLGAQRKVSAFPTILKRLHITKQTPEAIFAKRLLSRLRSLKKTHPRYKHMDIFLGEILGAVILGGESSVLNSTFEVKNIKVNATGYESVDGQIIIDEKQGKSVKVLENVDPLAYYNVFANRVNDGKQSAVVGSFDEQRRLWSTPSNRQFENFVKYGVLRDTGQPRLRQPQAVEVCESEAKSLKPGSKVTILANGPLTNIAKIVLADLPLYIMLSALPIAAWLSQCIHTGDTGLGQYGISSKKF